MRSLFGTLLRALAAGADEPVLFFADDLQWADPASLALLASLARGTHPNLPRLSPAAATAKAEGAEAEGTAGKSAAVDESPRSHQDDSAAEEQAHNQRDIRILFAVSYRDNEVSSSHPLADTLAQFRSGPFLILTNIPLAGFSSDALNKMLSDILRLPVRRVRPLTEIIRQKTDGRPLHVIEFLRGLTVDGLLTHSFERGWEWDVDSIAICPISDDVAELFSLKLHRLPHDTLAGLQVLSCFGGQVDLRILELAADNAGPEGGADLTAAVCAAVREGLVERAGWLVRFSHDVIQKAALDSVGAEELGGLLRRLAASLIQNASAAGEVEDAVMFVAVNLANRIGDASASAQDGAANDSTSNDSTVAAPSPLSSAECALFAKMNARASAKSLAVPDFAAAGQYAEAGIALLSKTCWEDQYELTLQLYDCAVLSRFSSHAGRGRGRILRWIDAVAQHARCFNDRFSTHGVWIKLLSMADMEKAIEESLKVLGQLGAPLDLRDVDTDRVQEELTAMKERFRGERKKKFLEGPRLSDHNHRRAMKVMSSLIVYYHMQGSLITSYVRCAMIKMSMNHGHCNDSVFAAAAFASALVNILSDVEEGTVVPR